MEETSEDQISNLTGERKDTENENANKNENDSEKTLTRTQKRKLNKKLKRRERRRKFALQRKVRRSSPEYLLQKKLEKEKRLEQKREEESKYQEEKRKWEEREKLIEQKIQERKEKEARLEKEKKEAEPSKNEKEEKEVIVEATLITQKQQSTNFQEQEVDSFLEIVKREVLKQTQSVSISNSQSQLNPNSNIHNRCLFYFKTGACRYGGHCGKLHFYPKTSNIILFKHMFKYTITQKDISLQIDEEIKQFEEFYYDIQKEFRNFGNIQIKVCQNRAPHLKGNVYVQFSTEEAAHNAHIKLTGRFYAQKQLLPEFVSIKDWSSAICGMYEKNRCLRGEECNFLHLYKNPDEKMKNLGFIESTLQNSTSTDTKESSNRKRKHKDTEEHHSNYKDNHYKHSHSTESSSRKRHKSQERSHKHKDEYSLRNYEKKTYLKNHKRYSSSERKYS